MVKSCTGEHHGVVIGPLRGVAPVCPALVPEVVPGRVANQACREVSPHREGKVHLQMGNVCLDESMSV